MINTPPRTPPIIAPTGADSEVEFELDVGKAVVEKGKSADKVPLVGDAAVRSPLVEGAGDEVLLGNAIDVVKAVATGFAPSLAVKNTVWIEGVSSQYQAAPEIFAVLRTYWLQYGEVNALKWSAVADYIWR
jgi:hypothetical protein